MTVRKVEPDQSVLEQIRLLDPALEPIRRRLLEGERLDLEDGVACLGTSDLHGLAALAHEMKRARHGEAVSYVLNRQLNPTNLCWLSCSFCDFAAKPGDAHAYELSDEQILEAVAGEIREVHVVGGLHPRWGFERYLDVVRTLKRARPSVQVKAYTAVEIDWFTRKARLSIEEVLRALMEAGVETLPGGGAEVFSARVQELLFPHKIGADRWLEVHRTAHGLGMPTGATMLYGHIETPAERVEHMLRLREVQDETGGFRAFIPLAYQPGPGAGSEATRGVSPSGAAWVERSAATQLPSHTTTAPDDLRTIATARLVLDNVDHVKAYWIMLGLASATCAIGSGASDVDGTVGRELIAHAAGAGTPEELTRLFLETLIRDAGAEPRERDALYQSVGPSEARSTQAVA
ncbi:MAG: CofH family radical SAM protein [Deltaproteobacteria bacterium]|nr:CofH family radical SAM protein [Deltaproteobacteria bacterium]